jgi:hypothetical protein
VTFQIGSPTTPLPANQVAGDFAGHKASIDAIIEFQKLAQRSDGNLQNGSVKPETLSAGTIALIGKWTPRGTWLTATVYAINDLIEQPAASGNNYVALVAHTSGVFATDLVAGKWMLIDAQAARLAGDQTFTGANTFSGATAFGAAATFTAGVDMTGGSPLVATKAVGDSTQAPASTAFVQAAIGKVYTQVFTSPPTTITMTIASPAVLSWAAHGLPIGGAFQLTTTGALPTGVSINTTYYVITAGFGANSFQFAATPGGAAIVSTGSQSGTHTGTPFYVPHAGMVNAILETWGGGGGGGGVAGNAGATVSGAGGGAGSYSRKLSTAAAVGASKAVTIGAAGAAGASTPSAGGNGGDTSVGALCVGKGGSGGVAGSGPGGLGGVAGTGDVTTTGMAGGASVVAGGVQIPSPPGGSSAVGGGGVSIFASGTGSAGTGHGSGGGGAQCNNNASNQAGGAGTAGYAVITEFCNQ